jgi:hypothetical protein
LGQLPFQFSDTHREVEHLPVSSHAHPECVKSSEEVVRAALFSHLSNANYVQAERARNLDSVYRRHVSANCIAHDPFR